MRLANMPKLKQESLAIWDGMNLNKFLTKTGFQTLISISLWDKNQLKWEWFSKKPLKINWFLQDKNLIFLKKFGLRVKIRWEQLKNLKWK